MGDKTSTTEVSRPRRARTGERAGAASSSRPDAGLFVVCAMVGVLLLVTVPASAAGLALLATLNTSDAPTQTASQQPRRESQQQPEPVTVKRAATVNVLPFKELLAQAAQAHARGEIDMSGTLEMIVESDINHDGSFYNVAITGTVASNPRLLALGEALVRSISDSHLFGFLRNANHNASHLRLTFKLDGQTFTAQALSELESPQRAAELATGYNALMSGARVTKKGKPEAEVWNNMTFSASGKHLAMRLEMSRAAAGNLLFKNLTPN